MTTNNSVNVPLSGSTGTGNFVGATSPTLVTPALGTPQSGNLANTTGYPITSVMKSGSGSGSDYTTASASYVDVDGTNLSYTVTVPNGYKVLINCALSMYSSIIPGTCLSAIVNGSTVLAEARINNINSSQAIGAAITYIFTGDGASHTFKLQFKQIVGNTFILNQSATTTPFMSFLMLPSA